MKVYAAPAEVKMVSFSTTDTGTASKVAKGNTVYTDSPNYLPPNSFASATVRSIPFSDRG